KQHNPDQDALLTRWHATLDKAGFDYKTFREQADVRTASYQAPPMKTADALTVEVSTAVTQAISLLSDNKTQFTYSEVLSKTLAGMQIEPGSLAQARAGIEAAISAQQLIPLDDKKGLFTSSIHLLDELSVQQLAGRIQSENRVLSFSAPDVQSTGVMATLADTAPTLAIVSSRGGANAQREQVEAAVSMASGKGRVVTVLATDRIGERFLAESPLLSERMINRAALTADLSLAANSTLVIANAEKLSVKETLLILDQAQRNNVQVLMMDSAGRKGTGNALATLEEAGVTRF
ncbi:MAG: conjugative transfer relaxase/helicase TraI, partial [Aeromonas sp.]